MRSHASLRIIVPITVAILLVAMISTAGASPTGEVAADVQTLEYSITIDSGSGLSFGSVDFGQIVTPEYGQQVVVTNTGTMDATLLCQGEDAQNDDGAVWALKDQPGPCEYAWSFTSDQGSVNTVHVSTTPRVLCPSIASGEAVTFTPRLEMPIATMHLGHFTWVTYICATAPAIGL